MVNYEALLFQTAFSHITFCEEKANAAFSPLQTLLFHSGAVNLFLKKKQKTSFHHLLPAF